MNITIVLYTISNLVLMLTAILLIPFGVACYYNDDAAMWAFTYTIIITGILGGFSKAFFRKKGEEIGVRDSIAIVTFSWIVCIFLGALPFWFSGVCTTYCDAVFETTSGFTTTGASIFKTLRYFLTAFSFGGHSPPGWEVWALSLSLLPCCQPWVSVGISSLAPRSAGPLQID
ncbi:MAG: hypothetical protein IT451_03080 [Candidatus Brocadia sp.]|nr:hypothetical protein [Candidatus Brocadia sp.]